MKVIDVIVRKEEMADGQIGIVCWVQLEDGSHIAAGFPWRRNTFGLWASDSDARDPAEIAATLRSFAAAIDLAAKEAKAA